MDVIYIDSHHEYVSVYVDERLEHDKGSSCTGGSSEGKGASRLGVIAEHGAQLEARALVAQLALLLRSAGYRRRLPF